MSSPKVIELNAERMRRSVRVSAAADEQAVLFSGERRLQSPALGQAASTAELVWLFRQDAATTGR